MTTSERRTGFRIGIRTETIGIPTEKPKTPGARARMIAKLRKQETRQIERVDKFWKKHADPIGFLPSDFYEDYLRMRIELMDLQKTIADLEYGR